MIDDEPLFRVGLGLYGVHYPPALRRAVAGVDVEVYRREAKGTVVARRVPERQDLASADGADEPPVVFPKPFFLHGGDYNPDQWLDRPDILEEDIRMMKKARVNCVSLGIFAWSALEPKENEYRFEWLDDMLEEADYLLKEDALFPIEDMDDDE